MTGENFELSVVVPVLNEEGNIDPLLAELEAVRASLDVPCEYVFVNDGSTDATLDKLRGAMRAMPHLRVFSHAKPCGKSEALLTCVRKARGRLIVMIDGDLQNDPADIPRLYQVYVEAEKRGVNIGIVEGQRTKRKDPFPRNLVSRIANKVRGAILNDETKDAGCGFKLLGRELFLALPFFTGLHRFMPALVKREGFEIALAPVNHRPRVSGVAKYNTWNRLWVGIGDLAAVWWLLKRRHDPHGVTHNLPDGKDEPCSPL